MVAGRTHQAKRGLVFAAQHAANGVNHAARCQQGNVKTAGTANGIGIEVATARAGEGPNLVDIGRMVNSRKAVPSARSGSQLPALGGQPASIEMRFHRPQPQRPFRMTARLVVQKPWISIKKCHGSTNRNLLWQEK
jgi:hypothetical protein